MAHHHYIQSPDGDLVDLRTFCSDPCHKDWCASRNAVYEGWNGSHEVEFDTFCDLCGSLIHGSSGLGLEDLPPWRYKTGEAIERPR